MKILREWGNSALDFCTDGFSSSENQIPIAHQKPRDLGDVTPFVACHI
jgi:hypothetical protein